MNARAVHVVVVACCALVAACQASSPVYRTYYVPETETPDPAAFVRAAESRCAARADAEAEQAFNSAFRSGDVNIPRRSGGGGGNAPEGLALSPAESQALVASRMANLEARQAQREAWAAVMKACMTEAGVREVSVCVSDCPP